jgi:hypothetical protein
MKKRPQEQIVSEIKVRVACINARSFSNQDLENLTDDLAKAMEAKDYIKAAKVLDYYEGLDAIYDFDEISKKDLQEEVRTYMPDIQRQLQQRDYKPGRINEVLKVNEEQAMKSIEYVYSKKEQ